jgi:hypothetical protein
MSGSQYSLLIGGFPLRFLWRLENMIILSQICLSKQKFLGKLNRIVIELSPKFELHRTRIENIPPFSATRAFFNSGTQVPAKMSN